MACGGNRRMGRLGVQCVEHDRLGAERLRARLCP
jgi:hypothetical protein